jgi:hypothetical protein
VNVRPVYADPRLVMVAKLPLNDEPKPSKRLNVVLSPNVWLRLSWSVPS